MHVLKTRRVGYGWQRWLEATVLARTSAHDRFVSMSISMSLHLNRHCFFNPAPWGQPLFSGMKCEPIAANTVWIPLRLGLRQGLGSWLAALWLVLASPVLMAASPDTMPFLLGTDQSESTLAGKWYRRIYFEAFHRIGVPMELVVVPPARLSAMVNDGSLHGQASRLASYADSNPQQIRVNEALHEARLALYAFTPAGTSSLLPKHLEDLRSGKWQVDYRRGIVLCEKVLQPRVPAAQLFAVTSTEQGMSKLRAGYSHLYCDFDLTIESELLMPTFRGVTGFTAVLDLGVTLQLYPYLHLSRAELVPKLAETLKKMKTEGLLARYLNDARRELEAAR